MADGQVIGIWIEPIVGQCGRKWQDVGWSRTPYIWVRCRVKRNDGDGLADSVTKWQGRHDTMAHDTMSARHDKAAGGHDNTA